MTARYLLSYHVLLSQLRCQLHIRAVERLYQSGEAYNLVSICAITFSCRARVSPWGPPKLP